VNYVKTRQVYLLERPQETTVWMRFEETKWVVGRGLSYEEEVLAFADADVQSTPDTSCGKWQLLKDKRGAGRLVSDRI
jgi:hypothetical protein